MKSSKHVLSAGLRARILKAILWPKIQRRYVAKATKSSANTADKLGELRAKMGIINELPITKALNRKFSEHMRLNASRKPQFRSQIMISSPISARRYRNIKIVTFLI